MSIARINYSLLSVSKYLVKKYIRLRDAYQTQNYNQKMHQYIATVYHNSQNTSKIFDIY